MNKLFAVDNYQTHLRKNAGSAQVSTRAGLLWFFLIALIPFALATPVQAEAERADVRIVIDISGSMKETDPDNLRSAGVKMLVEMLPAESQSGVWTFGRYVNMLVKHGDVDDRWRGAANRASSQISSSGQRTNLTDALDRAVWESSASPDFQRSVILLTDGKIDMAPAYEGDSANRASRKKLFDSVLPKYQQLGVRIHTLALSDAADKALLQQLAVETGGLFLEPKSADELSRSFLKAFDQAAPVEQVPMEDNRFEIDASVDEFTALVFRKSSGKKTELIAPDGSRYSWESSRSDAKVRWHQDAHFDLITIKNPQEGIWQANADIDPDNRVQILSDLRLVTEGIEAAFFSGDALELITSLTNEGEVVSERALLQLTDMTLKVVTPSGKTGSVLLSNPETVPEDGLFKYGMERMTEPGEYQFEIEARSPTFKRKKTLTSVLSEPFRVETEDDLNAQVFNIRVSSQSDVVDSATSRVLLRVVSPDGNSLIHSVPFDMASSQWVYKARGDQGNGRYEYQLNIRGVTTGGKAFRSQPEEFSVNFPLGMMSTVNLAANEPEVEEPALNPTLAADPASPVADADEPEDDPKPEPPVKPVAQDQRELGKSTQEGEAVDNDEDAESGFPWLWVITGASVLLLGVIGGLVFWWL
ncbi:MAG: VWA domain-containing protein, partial [Oceanobacter sp.]